jgi:hypothetical protein
MLYLFNKFPLLFFKNSLKKKEKNNLPYFDKIENFFKNKGKK